MSEPGESIRELVRDEPVPRPSSRAEEEIFRAAARGAERRLGARLTYAAGAAIAVAAAVLLLVWRGAGAPDERVRSEVSEPLEQPAVAQVVAASGGRVGGRPARRGAVVRRGEAITIGADERIEIALGRETVLVAEDAELAIAATSDVEEVARVELRRGGLRASGDVEIDCPECRARLRGSAEIHRDPVLMRTAIRVIAGSIEMARVGSCAVSYLELEGSAPASAEEGEESEPTEERAPAGERSARPREPARPRPPHADARSGLDEGAPAASGVGALRGDDAILAERIDRFERARALVAREPERALEELSALRAEWPASPVGAEIDYARLDAAVRAGRRDQARSLALELIDRHGRTRRSDLIERALGGSPE